MRADVGRFAAIVPRRYRAVGRSSFWPRRTARHRRFGQLTVGGSVAVVGHQASRRIRARRQPHGARRGRRGRREHTPGEAVGVSGWRRRWLYAMVGLAVVAVPVLATRSPTAAAVIPAPDIDAPALGQEAVDLEARMAVHLFAGQVLGDTFATAQKDPTQIVGTSGGGDSALWSGVYLAAESFRYAVAKRAVAVAHTGNVRHAAEAELAAAKARIDDLAFSAHRRISISGDWKATPCSADHVPTVGDANQSCGLADSQAGAAFRQCQPVGVPAYVQDQSPSRPAMIFGPIRWHEDGKDYYCEDGSSRDVYAGTTYGLLTAFDLVGPDDAVLRDRIRDDVISMTSYLVSHGWSVVRPHTTVSTSGSENFVFPLFVINPEPRLNMMTAARHVADVAGTPADQAQWDALYDTELALDGPQLPGEFELAIASPHNSYYNFNLNHLTALNTIRLAPNPVARDYLARQYAIIDAPTRDDIHAHYE